ncbi:hypothetical protein MASSI9I_70136 [Massilia sp. 9I]|nr:hypothetical protein MASSI9I_70136 [Massilia sp. 9I]
MEALSRRSLRLQRTATPGLPRESARTDPERPAAAFGLSCLLRQRAVFSAFNPSKLQTVAISPVSGSPSLRCAS